MENRETAVVKKVINWTFFAIVAMLAVWFLVSVARGAWLKEQELKRRQNLPVEQHK